MLKKRENTLLRRAKYLSRFASMIKGFSQCGFGSLGSVRTFYIQRNPEMTDKEFSDFWNIKKMDDEMLKVCESILENLKSE